VNINVEEAHVKNAVEVVFANIIIFEVYVKNVMYVIVIYLIYYYNFKK